MQDFLHIFISNLFVMAIGIDIGIIVKLNTNLLDQSKCREYNILGIFQTEIQINYQFQKDWLT